MESDLASCHSLLLSLKTSKLPEKTTREIAHFRAKVCCFIYLIGCDCYGDFVLQDQKKPNRRLLIPDSF